jgi:transcriptional regulator with XRE-family HTH domain
VKKSLFSEEYETFCRLLRLVREEAGISQNQLAKRLEVPQAWLSKVENGHRRLDILELLQIIEEIGIQPGEFVERLGSVLRSR